MVDVHGAWELLNALSVKPYRNMLCNGEKVSFLCDTGACKTVMTRAPPGTKFSSQTIKVQCANGEISHHRVTQSITFKDPETDRVCHLPVIVDPLCPVPLLGRDAMLALKIFVTAVRGGMVAKPLSDEDAEGVYSHTEVSGTCFAFLPPQTIGTWSSR